MFHVKHFISTRKIIEAITLVKIVLVIIAVEIIIETIVKIIVYITLTTKVTV